MPEQHFGVISIRVKHIMDHGGALFPRMAGAVRQGRTLLLQSGLANAPVDRS
jgi:hypothetical protein